MNITQLISVLGVSLIPTLALIFLILYSDRKSKEPLFLILICIFSGIFTIFLSLLISKLVLPSLNNFSIYLSEPEFNLIKIIILAIIEEYSKLFVLYVFIIKNKAFDDIYDGFVYSAIIALSFAVFETLMYVFSETDIYSMGSLAILRDFTTIPLHLVCGIIMGCYAAFAKFSKTKNKKIENFLKAMLLPVVVHTTYNSFFTFTISSLKSSNKFLIILIIFLLSMYLLGILFIRKIQYVNKLFTSNNKYPKEYEYLMNKDEFNKKI